ncbi:MAG: hypothetical protein K8L99_12720 [Anaerolineae bacterium]|nr:hypothetical protein [Anaerolineae bacterium]
MGIEYRWDNDAQTVIRMVVDGTWNWNDFHKNLRRMTFWLDSVDHPVELVIDLRASHKLPAGAFGHIRSLGKKIHPNGRDRVVIIGLDETLARQIGGEQGVYQDSERLIRFVPTDEAAQAVLEEWLS